jgi:hypothetical protein
VTGYNNPKEELNMQNEQNEQKYGIREFAEDINRVVRKGSEAGMSVKVTGGKRGPHKIEVSLKR